MNHRSRAEGIPFRESSPRAIGIKDIERQFIDAGLKIFATELHDREAYRAIFSFRRILTGLDSKQVTNLGSAVENARTLTEEILSYCRDTAAKAA